MEKKITLWIAALLLWMGGTAKANYVVGDRMAISDAADGKMIIIEAASTVTNYGYYVTETSDNKCHWRLGLTQNAVWQLEQADGSHYYIKNVASGRYVAPIPKTTGTASTTEAKEEAARFTFYNQASSPTVWTDYDNQTRYPRGWDALSWMVYDVNASYAWRNDVGKQADGNLWYGTGSHIPMWNVYAAVESKLPVADVLDVRFGANGAAVDVSPMANTVTRKGTVASYYNDRYGCYAAQFNNAYGGSTSSFYKIDYAASRTDGRMIAALKDGHTLETVFRSRIATEDKEAKWFSSHQQGGTGFLICKQANGRNGKNEITFLPYVGGYKWATSGVQPEVDEFYHVVGVWDKAAGKARIYINGQLKNEVAANGTLNLSSNDIYHWFAIGADPSAADGANTSGTWDIVSCKIYNDPLTSEQVDLIYKDIIDRTGRKALREYVEKVKATLSVDEEADHSADVSDYLTILANCEEAIASDEVSGEQYITLEQQLRKAYEKIVVLHSYSFLDNQLFTDSCFFPLHSSELAEGDELTLINTDTDEPAVTGSMLLTDKGGRIALPQDFTNGTYIVALTRGELTQTLGNTTLTKTTKMPKPAEAVAHRGWYTKGNGTSQNSRQAVSNAMEAGFYGCEIDVHQTTDGYIMVNHDFSIGGVTINQSTYAQVKDKTLGNGEKIPQLNDLFNIMKNKYPDSPTKLVIELKVNANTDTLRLANSVVEAVKKAGLQDRVEYISYGVSACRYIRAADPTATVASLTIISLDDIVRYDLQGIDYGYSSTSQAMIDRCGQLGISVNVYTVDNNATMVKYNNMGVDYITTNYPDQVQAIHDLYLDVVPAATDPDDDPSAISNKLLGDGNETQTSKVYDIAGLSRATLQRGINIVKNSNGTTRKIIVK